MSTTPAGWHPDPLQRHQLRYWSGTAWTEHVSDGGVVGRDPLAPAPAPAAEARPARHTYVDARVQHGLSTKRLFVDEQALWWGDEAVPFTTVTAVAWWATRVTAGPAYNIDYRLELRAERKKALVAFTGRNEGVREVFDRAVDALRRHPGQRIVDDALERIAAGETVDIGQWALSTGGARQGKKELAWSTPIHLVPIDRSAGFWVRQTGDDGKELQVGQVLLDQPNGPLVPDLFDACRARYG